MNHTKISVIIPVYNANAYLQQCLDSVTQQTFPHLQILLIDDGSTDGSGAICDAYAARDSRIQVIHQPNSGVASARNAGLDAANSEWVGWLDADDWIDTDFYENLHGLARQYGADLVQCGVILENGGEPGVQFAPEHRICFTNGSQVYPENGPAWFSNGLWNKLYRAELLKGIRFCQDFPIGEDLLFNLEVLERAGTIVLDNRTGYHYRLHSASVCRAAPDPKRLVSYREMLRLAQQRFRKRPGVQGFLWREELRNDLDICSKTACFDLGWADGLIHDIRMGLRRELGRILREKGFSPKEKLKFLMILTLWPVYRVLLPCWKRHSDRRREGSGNNG